MADIKNISLTFGCPENRNSLSNCNKGYFCSKCQHQVTDFTNSSKKELLNSLEKSNTPVCGIFKRSQLSKTFLQYLAVTMTAVTASVIQANGQGIPVIDQSAMEQTDEDMEILGMVQQTIAYPEGGYEKFYNAIVKEIRQPQKMDLQGKVYVQFSIDTLGNIGDVEVVKGLHEIADKEAVRVLEYMNYKFVPATQSGIKVKSRMVMPIRFGAIEQKGK